ncbi:hypothetical protein B566_EDAN018640, partial [Ephemera danica]
MIGHPAMRPQRQADLADALDLALPQTQCTRCGFADCRAYAEAMATEQVAPNRCPPGGQEGVVRLAALLHTPPMALDANCGQEAERTTVVIDEAWCIGCTLCIKACPVDCIVGASKLMHTVVEADCTGCELCVPVCPVDCIEVRSITPGRTGWKAWTTEQAQTARQSYGWHLERGVRNETERQAKLATKAQWKLDNLPELVRDASPQQVADKRQRVLDAMARARAKRAAIDAATQEAPDTAKDSVFELLIAVLLSAQATDVSVNKATRSLFALAPTPQRMLALGLEGVTQHIRTIGLFRTKAANTLATCQRLLAEHGGMVPRSREALERLPGVGRKTANVVLNVAF